MQSCFLFISAARLSRSLANMSHLPYDSGDLDGNILPSQYRITLEPLRQLARGFCEIDISIFPGWNGECIPIHASETVAIVDAKLSFPNYPAWRPRALIEQYNNEPLEVRSLYFETSEDDTWKQSGAPIKATLWMSFSSVIFSSSDKGIYQTSTGSHTKQGLCTQFEPCGARAAFPCFDEPALRCNFQLTLIVEKDENVISNTPIETVAQLRQKKQVTFEQTIPISTYLVAFVVGDFDSLTESVEVTDGTNTAKLPVTVWTFSGQAESGRTALQWACNAIKFFTQAFKYILPLKKLDLVGCNLQGLGMENWGLLTFRSNYFLINDTTDAYLQRRICLLILHEVSHLWFGDIVTIKWWEYLYVKEGFARLLEYSAAEILYPEFPWWSHFVAHHAGCAKSLDSDPASIHPVEVKIKRALDANDIFDLISYCKGASVLRMAIDLLGHEAFYKALPSIISSHAFGAIDSSDLWRTLEYATGVDLRSVSNWISLHGHPSLHFTSTVNSDNIVVDIHQELHLKKGKPPIQSQNLDSSGNICYPITTLEILIIHSNGSTTKHTDSMSDHSKSIIIPIPVDPSDSPIVILNPYQKGFFSVEYSSEDWHRIMHYLDEHPDTDPALILGLIVEASLSTQTTSIKDIMFNMFGKHPNRDIQAYINRVNG